MPTHYYVIVGKRMWYSEILLKFKFFRHWYGFGTFEYHIRNQHIKLHLLNTMNPGEPRFNQAVHFWFNSNHTVEPRFTCQKMRHHLGFRPLCLYKSYAHAIMRNRRFYEKVNLVENPRLGLKFFKNFFTRMILRVYKIHWTTLKLHLKSF